jgi:hypothetical protein
MHVSRDELKKYQLSARSVPAPIEPLLCAADEARLIAKARPGDPNAAARRMRVRAIIHRPAPPAPADAELLALLALRRALPINDGTDRIRARQRLAEIGRLSDPPPEVAKVQRRLAIDAGDGDAFADTLLPPKQDIGQFSQGTMYSV